MNEAHRSSGMPWTRATLFLAVVGPALCLGGVPSWVVPGFVVVVLLLVLSLAVHAGVGAFRVPRLWKLGAIAAAACLLQLIPLSPAGLHLVAPGLATTLERSLVDTSAAGASRISVMPGATTLECARMVALTLLFIAAAQLSWRVSATAVVAAGSLVSLIGITQLVGGTNAIYGLYAPMDRIPSADAGLLTTFVNPNHQSSLLLLGLFAAIALALDRHRRSHESRDAHRADRLAEQSWAAVGCAGLQLIVLLLSLSRATLVVAIVMAIPATILAVRGRSRLGLRRAGRKGALLILAALVGMAVLVGRLGAWGALQTLDHDAYRDKFSSVRDALDLIPHSPLLGSGRGSFVDLFPLVDRNRQIGEITVTHIESFPVAVLVEWGPIVGSLLLVGAAIWWITSMGAHTAIPRRIALIGVAAVALHNLADFNLEFLGVAAPLAALSGGLSQRRAEASWARTPMLAASSCALVLALALAVWGSSRSWPQLRERHAELARGEIDTAVALADRPLDARLHLVLARRAAEQGRWQQALTRSRVATELRPSSGEAWLLLAASQSALGERLAADRSVSTALRRIRVRPDAALVEHLTSTRSPRQLASLVDPGDPRWPGVLAGLIEHAPTYADALVNELSRTHPDDPRLLLVQAERALARGDADLALHHARLSCQTRPASAEAWVVQASALRHSLRGVDEAEIQAVLEHALTVVLDRPELVEEALILSYLADGSPEALTAAETLLPTLLERDALPEVARRRRELGTTIADLRRAAPRRP